MFNPFLLSGTTFFPGWLSPEDIGVFPFDEGRDGSELFDLTDFEMNSRMIAPEVVVFDRSVDADMSQLLGGSEVLMAQALFNVMVNNGHVFDAESSGCACCGHDHGMNAKQEIAAITDQIIALLGGSLESIGPDGVLAAIAGLGDVDAEDFSDAFQGVAIAAAQSGTGFAANEPNGTDLPADITTTGTIAVGGSATGTRGTATDEDWFAIDLDQGTTYTFIMLRSGADPHDDPLLNLYNSSGTLITSNDDIEIDGDLSSGENRNSFITFTATETGTVYLGASGWSTTTGDYTLYAEVGTARPDFTLQESAFFLTSQFDNKAMWGKTALTYDVSALSAAAQILAIAAMTEWADVSGLSFTQAAGTADITFNENRDSDDGSAQAFASTADTNGVISSSTITISDNWSGDYSFNSYRYQTYLHEVGHALGLGHAGPYNGQNVDAAGVSYHVYNQDAWNYSLMSYRDQAEAGTGTARLVLGAQVVDIIAIQDLYGVNAATRTGDSIYGFNSTETGVLDFEGTFFNQGIRPPSLSIYDAGGSDTLDFSGYSANQTISLVEGSFSSIGDNTNTADTTDALVNLITIAIGTVIENAKGGSGNDIFVGNGADNVFTGNGGNDTYSGGAGSDTVIFSGAQSSYTITTDETNGQQLLTISGGSDGTDQVDATNIEFVSFSNGTQQVATSTFFAPLPPVNVFTENADSVTGTEGDDVFDGLGGNDTIRGLGGNDSLTGGSGNDALYGGTGGDTLIGGTGEDYLYVDAADFASGSVSGGADYDTLIAEDIDGAGLVIASSQDTQIERFFATNSIDQLDLSGSTANLSVTSYAGADVITAGSGDDLITGGAGDDVINGGTGSDVAVYSANVADYVLTENSNGTITVAHSGSDGTDTVSNIETLRFADGDVDVRGTTLTFTEGNDTATGTFVSETIDALSGNDTLRGLGGNDTLNGGAGNDALYGGTGGDTLNGGTGEDYLYVDVADLTSGSVNGGDDYDTLIVEDLYAAGLLILNAHLTEVERFFATNVADRIEAQSSTANLTVYGFGGADIILTGSGDDYIYFDNEDITGGGIRGGAGYDWLLNNSSSSFTGTITIDMGVMQVEGYSGSNGTEIIDASLQVSGVTIYANLGADQITGGSGGDYIYVTSETASYVGGAGYDYLIYNTFDGSGLTVNLTATGFEGAIGRGGDDSFDASGNTVSASLYGAGGNDTLIGGSATDYFYGDTGNDTYTGNGGTDYFLHDNVFGNDTITDFAVGTDVMIVRTAGVASMANIVITQDGADALLTMGANSIRLTGVTAATLTPADFIFSPTSAEVLDDEPEVASAEAKPDTSELESFALDDFAVLDDFAALDTGDKLFDADMTAMLRAAITIELPDGVLPGQEGEAWVMDIYGTSLL